MQDHGRAAIAIILAGWLFILIAGNKYIKLALVGITVLALFFLPIPENNVRSVATSLAANALLVTREKLEQEHSQKGSGYPATATFSPDNTAKMFYRFEYVPLSSKPTEAIDGYALKARPLRYGCGIMRSFLLDQNGKLHTTQEDRDVTESDPILE